MRIESSRLFVQAGQALALKVKAPVANERQSYSWSADGGHFSNFSGNTVNFNAPLAPGKVMIQCDMLRGGRVRLAARLEIVVYSRVIILKADDLVADEQAVFPLMWNRYFDFVDSLGIQATAGIITQSLENARESYYQKIKSIAATGRVEFWNHGYSHQIHMKDTAGNTFHEFSAQDFETQKSHLLKGQELGKRKLGLVFKTFGAPGNFHDDTTLQAINENKEIKIWLYGNLESRKSILTRVQGCDIEFPVHYPDYQKFANAFYYVEEPVVTLQFHPTRWDPRRFDEFKRIVFHLIDSGAMFMTPTAYAEVFHPDLLKDTPDVVL